MNTKETTMIDILTPWQEWESRTGNIDSTLELHSDGSGVLCERDLYGPHHHFDCLTDLCKILRES